MSEAALLEEIRRLSESINHAKALGASRGGPPPARGGYRGRGRGRGALVQTHRNASWVAPGRQPLGATAVAPAPPAAAATPAQITAAKVPIPVGGFRNKSLVLNKPNPAPKPTATNEGATAIATSSTPQRAAVPLPSAGTEFTVDGVVFVSDARGTKLVRKPGAVALATDSPSSSTPRRTSVSGTQYIRTKSGNLVSLEFARRRKDAIEKRALDDKKDRLDRLVGIVKGVQGARDDGLGTRGRGVPRGRGRGRGGPARPVRVRSTKLCRFFTKTGQCTKALTCPFTHDSTRVAICPLSLRGLCPHSSTTCPLSHTPNANRSPHCTHFPSCTKGLACPYAHVHVSRDAPVCRAFVDVGWCEAGSACEERHVWECAQFSAEGTCDTRGCKLPHVLRRRNTGDEEDDPDEPAAGHEARKGAFELKRKRSLEVAETDNEDDDDDDDDVKGISAHARRVKKGKRAGDPTVNGPDGDLSANADFVELFVPFSEDDESDGDESVDSADLDGEEVDAAGLGTDEPETVTDAGVSAVAEEEEPYMQEGPDVSWRREERDYEEFEDDDDAHEDLRVERLLTR